ACIAALKRTDLAVLLIDRRRGSLYLGVGPYSITRAEYETCVAGGRPVIVCVREKAWNEAATLTSIENRDNRRVPTIYVESWDVIDFINRVQKASKDNWVIRFDGPNDLTERLRGRLAGLTRWVCEAIVQNQTRSVRATKTTTALALSLGDVIDECFVEPPYVVDAGAEQSDLSAQMAQIRELEGGILLVGEAGSGKTTVLARAFLEHAHLVLGQYSYRLPFYASLRGRGAEYHFSFHQFVGDLCEECLGKSRYPLLDLADIQPVLYLDGLDELTEDPPTGAFRDLAKAGLLKHPFILAVRTWFADAYLSEFSIGDRLSTICRLQPWTPDIAQLYVERFCAAKDCDDQIDLIKKALASAEMKEIGENPLLLTFILWIISQSGMTLPMGVTDKLTLYRVTLDMLARRELARVRLDSKLAHTLLIVWQYAAWMIYTSRYGAQDLLLSDLEHAIRQKVSASSDVGENLCLAGILDITRYTKKVLGLLHESVLEYLVAEALASSVQTGGDLFPEFLEYVVRPEINRLMRSIWHLLPEERLEEVLQNLQAQYFRDLTEPEGSRSIVRRTHCAYYIGRLPMSQAGPLLEEMGQAETEISVRLSLAFGRIKLLDMVEEDRLASLLESEDLWDKGNRGYHLVYYRDWNAAGQTPPFIDPGDVRWTRTLQALRRHIASTEPRHIALRRIEFITIRRFIETRGHIGSLSEDVLSEFSASAKPPRGSDVFPKEFWDGAWTEWERLRATWEAISAKMIGSA
ncbi:MAG: NACHT domain-containing protein, partial [Bacillota bacterium]|nr:NACHT domain-containing protein [Bacillota bacterium]